MLYIFTGHREHRQNTQIIFMGWCNDKEEGIFLSVDPFKEKTNQHRTLHLDPQRLGQSQYNEEMVVMINCINISKYILIGYISLSNGEWRKII